MKKINLIAAVFVFVLTAQSHGEFDPTKGFVYESEESKKKKLDPNRTFVKVLRLFNENNKIDDPALNEETQDAEVNLITFKDKVYSENIDTAKRDIASVNAIGFSWFEVEKELIEAESKIGIRSMPVVKFNELVKIDIKSFLHRVDFLESKLNIKADGKKDAFSIPQRLAAIKKSL